MIVSCYFCEEVGEKVANEQKSERGEREGRGTFVLAGGAAAAECRGGVPAARSRALRMSSLSAVVAPIHVCRVVTLAAVERPSFPSLRLVSSRSFGTEFAKAFQKCIICSLAMAR